MKAWSYSSLSAFETCPRRYYLTRVAKKVTEPPTEATRWGNEVHKALEDAVAINKPLPESMRKWGKYTDMLRGADGKVFAERQIALTKDLRVTDWFSAGAWCRGILDATVVNGKRVTIWDWKTGKVRPDSSQLKLFAALAFASYPEAEVVKTAFIWLVHDKITKDEFTRSDLPMIWGEFLPKINRLEATYESGKWTPKPSGLCRSYCPVGKANCEFCGG